MKCESKNLPTSSETRVSEQQTVHKTGHVAAGTPAHTALHATVEQHGAATLLPNAAQCSPPSLPSSAGRRRLPPAATGRH